MLTNRSGRRFKLTPAENRKALHAITCGFASNVDRE
jgi:hypothetical protein